jgi:hypothetical protein
MALFGAPRAHDDDPLRAARAALDIHEALARSNETARHPIEAHVGIASGEVVAGTIGRAAAHDYTVLGDSVNLAARLVGVAASGQTVISDGVHRALRGRGMCDALGEMALKGLSAPARVWGLRGISGDAVFASGGAFVGREAELEQFRSIAGACLGRRSGRVIFVRGEAGIGKRASSRRCGDTPTRRDSRSTARWYSISASAKARTRSARCCRACSACRRPPIRRSGCARRRFLSPTAWWRRIGAYFSTT